MGGETLFNLPSFSLSLFHRKREGRKSRGRKKERRKNQYLVFGCKLAVKSTNFFLSGEERVTHSLSAKNVRSERVEGERETFLLTRSICSTFCFPNLIGSKYISPHIRDIWRGYGECNTLGEGR